jgi:hypothetical protein
MKPLNNTTCMKLEDQYTTLYQSKKLKELGIDQSTQWYWCYPINDKMISTKMQLIHTSVTYDYLSDNDGDEFDHAIASAFSVAELGVLLPSGYDTMHSTDEGWRGYDHDGNDFQVEAFKTEAECRASMLIELLQRNIVTAEECNKRLIDK